MKGGSIPSDIVMSQVAQGECGALVLPTMQTGGSAGVMTNVLKICNCDHNLSDIPVMDGNVVDFHKTTGGGKKNKKSKRKRKLRIKKSSKNKTGGSVPYYLVMKGTCASCSGLQMISNFPGQSGGSSRTTVSNECIYKGPMFQ
tara:strand:- start:1408 stop:1836 length:429 start_codon:yes stop_codon:yes gene_type:complete